MDWIFGRADETFGLHRDRWDELNGVQGNHILLDSRFVGPLIRHFASKETLLGITKDPRSPAMVLVTKNRMGLWQTFQPAQAPLGLILLAKGGDVAAQAQSLMQSLPGYALSFSVLQQDPDCTCFNNIHESQRTEVLEYIKTPRLSLQGSFENYWQSRSKNLTHNLERQRRRLEGQRTKLEFIAHRASDRVEECIHEYGRLESTGWKAAEGTAITADNRQGMFYREILESFCDRDEGVIYELLMNGQVIASDLCLERGERIIILKTTYDESIKGASPGMLLHQEIFKNLYAKGQTRVVEFYGPLRDWHTKWTDEIRTMYHINFYRYGWIASARHMAKILRKSFNLNFTD